VFAKVALEGEYADSLAGGGICGHDRKPRPLMAERATGKPGTGKRGKKRDCDRGSDPSVDLPLFYRIREGVRCATVNDPQQFVLAAPGVSSALGKGRTPDAPTGR
jgi:hypothetical protein